MAQTNYLERHRIEDLSRTDLGAWGERCAQSYLRSEGYRILDRNWRVRGGELDIVASSAQRQAIVAVEVKTRRSINAGIPEEAVTPVKLQRLRSLLVQWVAENQIRAPKLAIDVIGVQVRGEHYQINHVKDVQ